MKKLPFKTATYNRLDFIHKESPTAIDNCMSLANALVVRPPDGDKEPHWNDGGEAGIGGLAALTVYYGKPGARSLQNVDEILNNPNAFETALKLMSEQDDNGQWPWNGMLARLGGRMRHWQGDEKGSMLSTMSRHLEFLRRPAIAAITRTTSFDTSKLVKGKMAVFIVPSLEHGRGLTGWVRMVIDGMLKAVMRCGLQETNLVDFFLDEAASLGQMDAIRDALDKGAAYGIRCTFFYQSVGQLNRCWPQGEALSLQAQTARVFFSVQDLETATQISTAGGEATILVESGGTSRGNSSSVSEGRDRSVSYSTSWNENRNWNQMARRLFKPEEVMTWSPRTAITFPGGGMAPVLSTLIRWYEEPWLTKDQSWFRKKWETFSIVLRSCIFLFFTILLAYLMTDIALATKSFQRFGQSIHTITKGGRR